MEFIRVTRKKLLRFLHDIGFFFRELYFIFGMILKFSCFFFCPNPLNGKNRTVSTVRDFAHCYLSFRNSAT